MSNIVIESDCIFFVEADKSIPVDTHVRIPKNLATLYRVTILPMMHREMRMSRRVGDF